MQLPASVQFTVHEAPRNKAVVASLFGPGRTLPTVLLTLVFMFNTFGVYFFMSWLPVLMKLAGLSLQGAILSTVLLNGGGAVGAATLGRLIDRFGGFRVMTPNYIVSTIAVMALGAADRGATVLIPALFVTGTCVMGAQIAMYAILDAQENKLATFPGMTRKAEEFTRFLTARPVPVDAAVTGGGRQGH